MTGGGLMGGLKSRAGIVGLVAGCSYALMQTGLVTLAVVGHSANFAAADGASMRSGDMATPGYPDDHSPVESSVPRGIEGGDRGVGSQMAGGDQNSRRLGGQRSRTQSPSMSPSQGNMSVSSRRVGSASRPASSSTIKRQKRKRNIIIISVIAVVLLLVVVGGLLIWRSQSKKTPTTGTSGTDAEKKKKEEDDKKAEEDKKKLAETDKDGKPKVPTGTDGKKGDGDQKAGTTEGQDKKTGGQQDGAQLSDKQKEELAKQKIDEGGLSPGGQVIDPIGGGAATKGPGGKVDLDALLRKLWNDATNRIEEERKGMWEKQLEIHRERAVTEIKNEMGEQNVDEATLQEKMDEREDSIHEEVRKDLDQLYPVDENVKKAYDELCAAQNLPAQPGPPEQSTS